MTSDAPDWEGQAMLDQAGKKIGTIQEIYLVEETGRPEWALVNVGWLKRRGAVQSSLRLSLPSASVCSTLRSPLACRRR